MTAQKIFARLGNSAGTFAEKYVPDPWIYVVILTFVAFIGAVTFTDSSIWQTTLAWQAGLWNDKILLLIAQFSINLILCTALARSPWMKKFLVKLARQPHSAFAAIWLTATVSIMLSLISWALCIVGGALFAQEICRQAKKKKITLHYPLAIAAGYLGMLTWGCGLTSSAALIASTPGHFLEKSIGVLPTSETIGSMPNLVIVLVLGLVCPVILALLHPTSKIKEFQLEEAPAPSNRSKKTFADTLENNAIILKLGALLPLTFIVNHFLIEGKGLTINSMNLIFLVGVMFLYSTPRKMLHEISQAASGTWSIVFQFPFYAGLMGVIVTTGLGKEIAAGFAQISTPTTWPTIGIAFQGLLNVFVPSGGSQWIVSGEILVDTSKALGFSPQTAVLIEIMGDQLTNMIQPMWALPALALAQLRARDIMGYTGVVMIFAFVVMSVGLTTLAT